MNDDFKASMASKTNEELIAIVTIDVHRYQHWAVAAAKEEIRSRNIDKTELAETTQSLSFERIAAEKREAEIARQSLRAVHFLVDTFAMLIVCLVYINIRSYVFKMPIQDGNDLNIMYLMFFFFIYVMSEYLFQKTPAKFIMQTKVVMAKDGSKPGFLRILGRNLARFIPFDIITYLFFSGGGMHDRISGTIVIMDKKPRQ